MRNFDVTQLEAYGDDWDLMPLHRWDAVSVRKGKERQDGKRPLDVDWTTRAYDRAAVMEAARRGHNVGVRLKVTQLVVDVDPRNMPPGRDTFRELCAATGLDPQDYPHVRTGSGGFHIYMAKPEDSALVDSLEGYEGVEFKSLGRQVVAAGSVHPSTGEHYVWESFLVDLWELPDAPPRLLELAARPVRADASDANAGQYTQQEVAAMLDVLDPEEFRDQTRWLELMMACHHASGGMARDEFIEWSTRDPAYQDDAWSIGRRWDSLHANKRSSITVRTLFKHLHGSGQARAIPARALAPDEFDDGLDDGTSVPGDDRSVLERCNDNWVSTTVGGKHKVFHRKAQYDGPDVWEALGREDFVAAYMSRTAVKATPKGPERVVLAREWLRWPKRREAAGVVFRPMLETRGFLNLWNGWAVEPKPGDWSLLRQLIRENLCDDDPRAYDYVMRWMAYMVQKPWEPAETALCFHGDKGTGKSTLGEVLCSLAGLAHGITVTSSEHFTGRFNGHLQDKVFVFADEAISPTDRDGQEMLKTMITSRTAAYERKGLDIAPGPSCLHVMMASNHDWFVPVSATDGERRYAVMRVNDGRRGDKAFFEALYRQMYQEGGLQALMHDLKVMDLGDWKPRDNVPSTAAMDEQKIQNLDPIQKWWHEVLWEGMLPCEATDPSVGDADWQDGPVRFFREDLRDAFYDWAKREGIRPGSSNRGVARVFWNELSKVTGDLPQYRDAVPDGSLTQSSSRDGRAWAVEVPSLADAREQFRRSCELSTDWWPA